VVLKGSTFTRLDFLALSRAEVEQEAFAFDNRRLCKYATIV
tara:strand:+ start:2284 stop:2406 length:123 start_codon:yes stop_codon:yes gene_type:complete